MRSAQFLLSLGLFLMLLGILFPLFMVVHVLESTFFLNFFSWGSSVVGWAIGIIAVARLVKS